MSADAPGLSLSWRLGCNPTHSTYLGSYRVPEALERYELVCGETPILPLFVPLGDRIGLYVVGDWTQVLEALDMQSLLEVLWRLGRLRCVHAPDALRVLAGAPGALEAVL